VKSCLYEGVLRHRRLLPRPHEFKYRVYMPYICLSELPDLFADKRFWSSTGPALAQFRRSDFLGDPALALEDEVRRRIYEQSGEKHTGPVYLLANLRYFGHIMNPIACYYCFSEDESKLEYLVAEVNNTPWDERHSYVLPGPQAGAWLKTRFGKAFHVSPFNPMDMDYNWRSNTPERRLVLHMENIRGSQKIFDATLSMQARVWSAANLNKLLIRHPLMTAKIGLAIYWQALLLYLKGTPVYQHPGNEAIGVKK
jgi:DUF1365 family protein